MVVNEFSIYKHVGRKNRKTKLTQMIKYIDYLATRKMPLKHAQGKRRQSVTGYASQIKCATV